VKRSDHRVLSWIIATRNFHKVAEIQAILGGAFVYRTLKDFPDAPTVAEDAPDFAGNATKKAVELARWVGALTDPSEDESWVLADDSGLEVDALHGAPGVHSARFAAIDSEAAGKLQNSSDAANNAKLLRLLADVPSDKRTARFRCCVAISPIVRLSRPSAESVCCADESELRTQIFEGACEGRIALAPAGRGGFGYDPLFVPRGYEQSFAQLGEDIKNRLSHRAQALIKLSEWLAKSELRT